MVETIHLVRHGHHAMLGHRLCGRMPGVQLDDLGCRQMSRCAEMIPGRPAVIQSSPQRRAQQSASILAWHFGLPVEIAPDVDELDYGEWTSGSFADLADDPRWNRWNTRRSTSRPPGGESMQALQQRMVQHLEQLRRAQADGAIVIVSHAEPIRAALLYYSRTPMDNFPSIEIDPASVSTLAVDKSGIRISRINQQVPA
ncbi:histidine phosphatase family protein [Bradyrhizobium archetypum]|uniref:Histidine phosphatase family protein n=1 Tax=Bradyrhizobium archetypum TaxID=2721160 RepID=A0A7Y4H6F6_9BRAD|nr:histidine phosphatase family protein [Bradyrhizobium archetypum]NOJ47592.1 histidine phosphatase family protein [Bradyrhizobium archetypum]